MGLAELLENRRKVLGMNERNLRFIRKYNNRKAVEIADNKILTKKVLTSANIPTPKLINIIHSYQELNKFDFNSLPNSFVVKPVSGLEGGGIDIFYNRDKENRWIRADKTKVTVSELQQQIKEILDGRYSLNQIPDEVLFEERVKTHKAFKYYTFKGTPDIRIIICNRIPLMSYVRLPTIESKGKANLALGAIGAGIDMANGTTTSAIKGKAGYIEYVPDTKLQIGGLKIPFWDKILRYAIEAQIATKLEFMAVDFLIDRELGPMIVEINARPGLSIQLANRDGLRWRLKKVGDLKVTTVEKGIRLAKYLFGGEIENEIETISGKDVIGIYEKVTLYDPNLNEIETKAKIDTGADSTSIDRDLAEKLGFKDIISAFDAKNIPDDLPREEGLQMMKQLATELLPLFPERLIDVQFVKSSHGSSLRPYIKLTMKIDETTFETYATVYDRSSLNYPVIVGRKSLTRFLVDPSKNKDRQTH
jgi:alpha-L-glutamate ligase-like protein